MSDLPKVTQSCYRLSWRQSQGWDKGASLLPVFWTTQHWVGVRNVSFLRRQYPLLTSGDYAGKRRRESQEVLGGIRGFQREQAVCPRKGPVARQTSQEGKLCPPPPALPQTHGSHVSRPSVLSRPFSTNAPFTPSFPLPHPVPQLQFTSTPPCCCC